MTALEKYGNYTFNGLVEALENECKSRDKLTQERVELRDEVERQKAISLKQRMEIVALRRQIDACLLDAARSTPPLVAMPKNAKECDPYLDAIVKLAVEMASLRKAINLMRGLE